MEEIKTEQVEKNNVVLKQEDFNNLKIREDLIFQYRITANLLQNERDVLWLTYVKRYNLDETKLYDINKDGVVTEKEVPKK